MNIIIFIIGLALGLFGFSQIIYPLFFTIPKAKQLQKQNKLKKPIPILTILIAPIIWTIIFIGSILIMSNYLKDYLITFLGTLVVMLIVVIIQIPKKNKDLESDLRHTWRNYFKDDA